MGEGKRHVHIKKPYGKYSYSADVQTLDKSTEILHEIIVSLEAVKHKYITPLHKYIKLHAKYVLILIFFPTLFICLYLDLGANKQPPQDWLLIRTGRVIEPWVHNWSFPVTGTSNQRNRKRAIETTRFNFMIL